uniref:Uncharacterized protein n=1 Tax=Leersia perrieri TaxID=77586 RepID=A0A0D9XAY9_9ORYZ
MHCRVRLQRRHAVLAANHVKPSAKNTVPAARMSDPSIPTPDLTSGVGPPPGQGYAMVTTSARESERAPPPPHRTGAAKGRRRSLHTRAPTPQPRPSPCHCHGLLSGRAATTASSARPQHRHGLLVDLAPTSLFHGACAAAAAPHRPGLRIGAHGYRIRPRRCRI